MLVYNLKLKNDKDNILYLEDVGNYFEVNEIGKEIIKLIKEGKDKITIINILEEKYKVDRKTLYKDVESFYLKLKSLGLI